MVDMTEVVKLEGRRVVLITGASGGSVPRPHECSRLVATM